MHLELERMVGWGGLALVAWAKARNRRLQVLSPLRLFWRDRYCEAEAPFGFGWAIPTQLGGPERNKN